MTRKFIGAITAAALTLTTFSAAPARAELSDIEKLLLGAGALAIIGTAIHEGQKATKKKKRKKIVLHQPWQPAVQPTRAALPAYCLRTVRAFGGDRRIFGARCLRNNYAQVNRLPNRCKTYVEGPQGTRVGFRPRCLRKAGYTVRR